MHQEQNNKQTITDLGDLIDKINTKSNNQSDDEDDGSELDSAAMLYGSILTTIKEMLETSETQAIFTELSKILGDKTESLVNLLVFTMTHSAYSAIIYYDELLKNELANQFDHMTEFVNNMNADITAMKSVIKVHSKKIDEINQNADISKFRKDNNI